MTTFTLKALTAALFLAVSCSSFAAPMAKADYTAAKNDISTKYKMEHTACKDMSGNAKDICVEEAKGREKIAKAELEESYQPSEKHRYGVRMANADAVYAVAKEKCDDAAGNAKDVCRKEAKAAYVSAKADAKLVEKTSDANATARETKTEARTDAATDKRNAEYAVAKEKCDALAGDAKTACIKNAKTAYGQ